MTKQKPTPIVSDSWVKPYLQQNKKWLLLVLILGVATFFSAAALMFTSGYLISKSATRPENILLVYVPIVLVRTFGISRPVFKYLERMASHHVVLRILSKMRVRLYQCLESQALTVQSTFATGDLLGVLADDLEHLQNLYLRTIFPSIIAVILYIISVIALGFFSIPFALCMALFLFVLVVLLPLVSLLINRKRQAQMKQVRNNLYQTLTDAVMGISDWKISGRQADFLTSYEAQEKQQDALEQKMDTFNRWRNLFFQLIVSCMTIIMIWFASTSVEVGMFAPIWIAAFVLVVFPITEAFAPISEAISHLPSYENSLQRLHTIEATSKAETVADQEYVQQVRLQSSLKIEMNEVTFSYEKDLILQAISLHFQPGEKVAILGKSGAGKSTIAKLLLGSLMPDSGTVTIQDVSVTNLQSEMASFISVLQQKPHLFDTTVMNNIRLGHTQATDEEVMEAAKQVQMHDYISSLPDGYQTRMHELGERFSGGERQRIALARILLQQTPIVILDEPTVGLDAITERDLLETIFHSLQGKTVIWITHHLVGVEQMDRVLFIEDGKIKMEGTHEELLQTNDRYAHLYRLDRPI